jgi:amino acid permease
MKNNKAFLHIIIFYFIASASFHFLRLALDWKLIIVGDQSDYSVSTLISAICILFSVFIVYLAYKFKKKDSKKIEVDIKEEEKNY